MKQENQLPLRGGRMGHAIPTAGKGDNDDGITPLPSVATMLAKPTILDGKPSPPVGSSLNSTPWNNRPAGYQFGLKRVIPRVNSPTKLVQPEHEAVRSGEFPRLKLKREVGHGDAESQPRLWTCTKRMAIHAYVVALVGLIGFFGGYYANSDLSEIATSPSLPVGLRTGRAPQTNRTSQTNATVFRERDIERGNFAETFNRMLVADELGAPMAPFILEDGVFLCRVAHFEHFARSPVRYRNFFDMLDTARRHGLHDLLPTKGPIPLFFVHGDGNGCNVANRRDKFGFPRLTMSNIADKHSDAGCAVTAPTDKKSCKWCKTVPIPTFEIWDFLKRKNHGDPSGWDRAFGFANEEYPWDEKWRKAVWRGTSTADQTQYGGKPLKETPRGRVAQMGMDRPDLIDAALVELVPPYLGWENTTRMVDKRMPFGDQMNYAAIIDVDGKP